MMRSVRYYRMSDTTLVKRKIGQVLKSKEQQIF